MILAIVLAVAGYASFVYFAFVLVGSWLDAAVGASLLVATFAMVFLFDRLAVARRARLDDAGLPRVRVERLQRRAKAELAQDRRRQQLRVIRGGQP